MIELKKGTTIVLRVTGSKLVLTGVLSDGKYECIASDGSLHYYSDEVIGRDFTIIDSALDIQHGGDHYKKLGDYQPWQVLKVWLTPEEFRGYMKGTAIAYLAREGDKGGILDIKKAAHTLQAFIEMEKNKNEGL